MKHRPPSWREKLTDERMLHREFLREEEDLWTGASQYGVVSSAHYHATAAGVEMLEQDGNAVDAAVAVSLALGVVEPAGSGIGGMALMLLHLAASGQILVLEGPCRAPVQATPEAVAEGPRESGYTAVAVPTNIAVLDYALQQYGTLTCAQVLRPAIRLAENGSPLTHHHCDALHTYRETLASCGAGDFFLNAEQQPFPVGHLFRQPVLAQTLRRLADAGFADFYQGEIAQLMLTDMQRNGGFISAQDFKDIPYPQPCEPLTGSFKNWRIATMPPPGGGMTLLQMLNLFEVLEPERFDPQSPQAALLFAAIIQRCRVDRSTYAVVMDETTVSHLSGKPYASQAATDIRNRHAGIGETSHFCVMDRWGNIVSQTQSIERSLGAKVVTPELGFLYNGYMKTFKVKNRRHPFYLRPGAKARSNAAPTIIFENGQPRLAIGSTGSERLSSGIFQVLVRLHTQSPFEAVKAPRLHCTPEGQVFLEADRFPQAALRLLQQHGFSLEFFDSWSFDVGGLHLALFNGHEFSGVAEPRRDGAAAGPDEMQR